MTLIWANETKPVKTSAQLPARKCYIGCGNNWLQPTAVRAEAADIHSQSTCMDSQKGFCLEIHCQCCAVGGIRNQLAVTAPFAFDFLRVLASKHVDYLPRMT